MAISRFIYFHSSAFGGQAANATDFKSRIFKITFSNGFYPVSVFCLAYLILCMLAYAAPFDGKKPVRLLYFGMAGGTVFYTFVLWHPQWLMLIVPFLVITTVLSDRRDLYILFDIVFEGAYVVHTLSLWSFFGVPLVTASIFGAFLRPSPRDGLISLIFATSHVEIFTAALLAVLIVGCILKNPFRYGGQYEMEVPIVKKDTVYRYVRFLVGMSFYLVPMLSFFAFNFEC